MVSHLAPIAVEIVAFLLVAIMVGVMAEAYIDATTPLTRMQAVKHNCSELPYNAFTLTLCLSLLSILIFDHTGVTVLRVIAGIVYGVVTLAGLFAVFLEFTAESTQTLLRLRRGDAGQAALVIFLIGGGASMLLGLLVR